MRTHDYEVNLDADLEHGTVKLQTEGLTDEEAMDFATELAGLECVKDEVSAWGFTEGDETSEHIGTVNIFRAERERNAN